MDAERIYARLPVSLQQAALNIEGWRIRRQRYGPAFHRLLDEYHQRSFWSYEQLQEFRDQRLQQFVRHAVETVPYYRDLFRELGALPDDFRCLEDLRHLPILTRRTVQEACARFASEAFAAPMALVHTSGTTGAGLRFPASRASQQEHWAAWWRFRQWHGIRFDTPCMYFGGRSIVPAAQRRPPFWRHNRVGRQLLFSGYHLSHCTATAYLEAMRCSGIRWLHGYPSLVALLAGFALELGIKVDVEVISLGAENVLPHHVDLIEGAFGVRPISHYSMAEGVANVSQCPEGRFHVDEDFAATEFVPDEQHVSHVVGTNFSNPAFPLLRYDTGDLATLEQGACTCGRAGRLVRDIDGRDEDVVITKRGALLGRLDHIFKDMVHIREAQIHQERLGVIELRIVRSSKYDDNDEGRLREEVRKRLGDDMEFSITYVEEIVRAANGKLRFVVSSIASKATAKRERE